MEVHVSRWFAERVRAVAPENIGRGSPRAPLLLATVPKPDEGTLKAVAALRAKPSLSTDEQAFLEYFDLLEEIRAVLQRM